MGFLSGWFSSSGAGGSAGKLSSPASASGGGSSTSSGPAAAAKKPNVWRSVFDPGSNPNVDKVGSAYYDTVKDPKTAPTTWDMILRAEDFKRRSFSDVDRNKDGYVDATELRAALPASVASKADTAALIAEAKAKEPAKGLSRAEFGEVLDRYFLA